MDRFFLPSPDDQTAHAPHPFDIATNEVLTLVSRAKPRVWVDLINLDSNFQPLGYLIWAAAGKEPGMNPSFILQWAARARYTEVELAEVQFEGERPTAASLSLKWKSILAEARNVVEILPWQEVGKCVLDAEGNLLRPSASDLATAAEQGNIRYHEGSLRGAYPKLVG